MVDSGVFTAPGHGQWDLDRSHYPQATTPISVWLIEAAMEAGTGRVFEELGVPAESVRARFVNGFMYTRLSPLIAPDRAPKRLPPPIVLKLASRLHPAFRRRTKAATAALANDPSTEVVTRWRTELRPSLQQRNRAFQDVDLVELTDDALVAHVRSLLDHLVETSELHFWLHGHDLGPIARYLQAALGWGLVAEDALAALANASPSTTAPMAKLIELREQLERHGVDPVSIEDVRGVSPEASVLVDEYLDDYGNLVVTGYDITDKTLTELPGLLLDSIRTAAAPIESDHDEVASSLRAKVSAADREEFDRLLTAARSVMDMRDDNGPLTFEWPIGLLRLALLELGRRLVAQGHLAEIDHALELTPDEARDPFGQGRASSAAIAARAAKRVQQARLDPPNRLGSTEAPPSLDVLPAPLATMVGALQTTLAFLDLTAGERVDPLRGSGIGTESYTGRARIADSPEEAIERLEPGDVLIVRATSPAFNTVLAIAGAVVTTHGGPLSHAAVIAREFGIPAVIGAAGARDLLDGSMVEVDPVAGTVRALGSPPA